MHNLQTKVIIFFLFAAVVLSGCPSRTRQHIDMTDHPIFIQPGEGPLTVYDDEELNKVGSKYFEKKDYKNAALCFQKIVENYPKSIHYKSAVYNLALSLEMLERCEEAKQFYQKYSELTDTSKDIDYKFRTGYVSICLKEFEEADRIFSELLNDSSLTELDIIEAKTNLGVVKFSKKDYKNASELFNQVIIDYAKLSKEKYIENNFFVAQSIFYLGEIESAKMKDIVLEFPQELLERRLEEKAKLLLSAQNPYLRVIKTGNILWATAAGFKTGELYEVFYDHLINAPIPEELTDEQKEIYKEELKKKIAVLITKAVRVYEATIDVGKRTGMDSKWISYAKEHMEKLKELFIEEHIN
ncbi:MAG: tetratricopeptide repeat protein [Deltaproteobacteria bacterium]|nr:tetratricopeptide repeat protein [Deltaproteobacteria bacterium]